MTNKEKLLASLSKWRYEAWWFKWKRKPCRNPTPDSSEDEKLRLILSELIAPRKSMEATRDELKGHRGEHPGKRF